MYYKEGEKHYFREECSEIPLIQQAKDFTLDVKKGFITEMLVALQKIHDEGLVHGNILPESFRLNKLETYVRFDYLQSKQSTNVDDKQRDVERVQKLVFMLVCNEADYENIKSLESEDLQRRAKEALGDSYQIFHDFLQRLSRHGFQAGLSHPFLWKPDKWVCFINSLYDIYRRKPDMLKGAGSPPVDWIERLKFTKDERKKWYEYDEEGIFFRRASGHEAYRKKDSPVPVLRLIVNCSKNFDESRDWEKKHLELEKERLSGELRRLESRQFPPQNGPQKQIVKINDNGNWMRPKKERDRKDQEMDRVNREIRRNSNADNWRQREPSQDAAVKQQMIECKEQESERMKQENERRKYEEKWSQDLDSVLIRKDSITADIFKLFYSRFPSFFYNLYLFVKGDTDLRLILMRFFEVGYSKCVKEMNEFLQSE